MTRTRLESCRKNETSKGRLFVTQNDGCPIDDQPRARVPLDIAAASSSELPVQSGLSFGLQKFDVLYSNKFDGLVLAEGLASCPFAIPIPNE